MDLSICPSPLHKMSKHPLTHLKKSAKNMKNMMIDNNTLICESVALLLQMLHDIFCLHFIQILSFNVQIRFSDLFE